MKFLLQYLVIITGLVANNVQAASLFETYCQADTGNESCFTDTKYYVSPRTLEDDKILRINKQDQVGIMLAISQHKGLREMYKLTNLTPINQCHLYGYNLKNAFMNKQEVTLDLDNDPLTHEYLVTLEKECYYSKGMYELSQPFWIIQKVNNDYKVLLDYEADVVSFKALQNDPHVYPIIHVDGFTHRVSQELAMYKTYRRPADFKDHPCAIANRYMENINDRYRVVHEEYNTGRCWTENP
jgi:hypothetical protein